MTHTLARRFIPLSLAAALVFCGAARGQDQPAPKAAPPAKAADKAAPAPRAARPESVVLPGPTDAAVQTILDSRPKTPADLMQAVVSLLELGRADVAQPLLQQLVALKPDPAASAELIHRFGSAVFLQLADDPRFAPAGLLLSQEVLGAAAAAARNPARLAAAVKQLGASEPDVQRQGLATLHDAGAYAVPPLLAALADPAQAAIHPLIQGAIISLGSEAIKPLAAAIDDGNPARAAQAINLLAAVAQKEAAIYLFAPALAPDSPPPVRQAASEALEKLFGTAATRYDAITLLIREVRSYLDGQKVLRPDDHDNIAIWNLDRAAQRFVVSSYPPSRATAFVALRLAGDLLRLDPDSLESRRLYLISLLDTGVYRVGLDTPLPTDPGSDVARAAAFGVDAISDALAQAMTTGQTAAAQGAARVLQAIGSAAILTRDGARPCPLVAALRSDDRRVRRAAAEAIMSFRPRLPFAGSSYLTDVAAELATSSGHRLAVIGFPTTPTAQQLGALAAGAGYEPVTATNGYGVFAAATQSADTEFVLISGRIARPDAFDLVQQLHNDPRTAQVPIGVMGELADLQLQTKRFAPEAKVFVVLRPEAPAEMAVAVAKSVQLSGDRIIPPMLRLQEAAVALDWLAEMALAPPEMFDVRRYESVIEHALYQPLTATHAAAAMARLGTHSSQVALLDLASLPIQPLDVRQAAEAAFAESVGQFGLRLAPSEVVRQYDRYNQSARLDKPTQELLGRILDVIEAPTKKNQPAAAAARQVR